jgi:hypothetical protein
MSKLIVGSIIAIGLSLGFATHPYAAESSPKKTVRATLVRGQAVCHYHCSPGLHVCPSDDTNPRTGCPVSYRCVRGLIGSNDCP